MRPDHHTAAFSGNMHGLGWSPYKYKYKLEYWTALPLPIYGLVRPQFLFQCFRPCLDRRKFKEKLWYYSSLDISQEIKHSLKPMVFVSFTVGWGNTSEKNLHKKKHERETWEVHQFGIVPLHPLLGLRHWGYAILSAALGNFIKFSIRTGNTNPQGRRWEESAGNARTTWWRGSSRRFLVETQKLLWDPKGPQLKD